VEGWQPAYKFDGIISRAFAELGSFLEVSKHLIASDGRWAAMKGQPESELAGVTKGFEVEKIISLKVPGLEAVRSLVIAKLSREQTV
jgi:16S rRNA (guanine527-N7)-methyltransferase